MGIDALLKRFFPVVVVLLIGIAAYFQASGIGRLVAAAAAVDPSSMPAAGRPARSPPSSPPVNPHHTTDGYAILLRNPFDSKTDLLKTEQSAPPEATVDDGDELLSCEGGRVALITTSEEDPGWSFASIVGGDGKSTLRRVGDEVNGHTIDAIEWDRVVMTSGSGRHCQMLIGAEMVRGKPGAGGLSPEKPVRTTKRQLVPEEIASRIHQIGPTHFEVERSVIGQILENQVKLMGSVRAKTGGAGGIELSGIRPGSLLESLGVQNGDRLQSVNGFDISDPAKAIAFYPRLSTAERLTVAIQRGGKPVNIEVGIK